MSHEQIRDALSPVFATFCDIRNIDWTQYSDVLIPANVNPGDFDEGLLAVKRDHSFHNAPLPRFVLDRVLEAKRKRIAATPAKPEPKVDALEGVLHTHTIKGIGTLKIRVLPDDHPSLTRFYCLACKDTGWEEVPSAAHLQMTVRRCGCWLVNPELQRERERNARHIKERER